MKIKKIKISLIFKLITIVVFCAVFALVVKYYRYYQADLLQLHENLTAIIVLNDNIEDLENVVTNLSLDRKSVV